MRPRIIALPGTLLDARSLAAALAGTGARLELLGAGATLEAELDRLARCAAQAGGPAWWIGHSLGGIVALQLAARHPQAVAGLVLLAANARGATPALRTRGAAQWEAAQRQGLRSLARCELGPAYGLQAVEADALALAEQAEAVGMARFAHQLAYAGSRHSPGGGAPWLQDPVLALSGAGDTLCPPPQSDEIVALARPGVRARHACLADAGHLFPMQQPDWVAAQLRDFIGIDIDHKPLPMESPA